MKAPKLVKTKKSQLKVPVTTAGRKMQFYRNSNRSDSKMFHFSQRTTVEYSKMFCDHYEQKSIWDFQISETLVIPAWNYSNL